MSWGLQSKQAKESAGQKEKEDKPDEEEEEEEEDWGELEVLDDYPFSTPDSKDNIVLDVGAHVFHSSHSWRKLACLHA